MAIWGDFQGLTGVTGGGRGVKKMANWGDVIYRWSLSKNQYFVTMHYFRKKFSKCYVDFI